MRPRCQVSDLTLLLLTYLTSTGGSFIKHRGNRLMACLFGATLSTSDAVVNKSIACDSKQQQQQWSPHDQQHMPNSLLYYCILAALGDGQAQQRCD
ncbi:hypothetical protein F4803DRAFT_260641 [Xylaria telfairii]|nr:hypothetical protein F4803DRAFT_260641 [Xylaria telfairii]